jgi:hypothetical protein
LVISRRLWRHTSLAAHRWRDAATKLSGVRSFGLASHSSARKKHFYELKERGHLHPPSAHRHPVAFCQPGLFQVVFAAARLFANSYKPSTAAGLPPFFPMTRLAFIV